MSERANDKDIFGFRRLFPVYRQSPLFYWRNMCPPPRQTRQACARSSNLLERRRRLMRKSPLPPPRHPASLLEKLSFFFFFVAGEEETHTHTHTKKKKQRLEVVLCAAGRCSSLLLFSKRALLRHSRTARTRQNPRSRSLLYRRRKREDIPYNNCVTPTACGVHCRARSVNPPSERRVLHEGTV